MGEARVGRDLQHHRDRPAGGVGGRDPRPEDRRRRGRIAGGDAVQEGDRSRPGGGGVATTGAAPAAPKDFRRLRRSIFMTLYFQ
jgi:hypothetical protein